MGLLATEFDEEEFKREYGKVCYEDGLKDGRIEGRKEGIKIGEEKGVKRGQKVGETLSNKRYVLNMYKNGIGIDMISNISGLDIKEINKILSENNNK